MPIPPQWLQRSAPVPPQVAHGSLIIFLPFKTTLALLPLHYLCHVASHTRMPTMSSRGRLSRIYCRALFWKVFSNFRHKLAISHLVDCLNIYGASGETGSFDPFFQFALGLARPHDQNSL